MYHIYMQYPCCVISLFHTIPYHIGILYPHNTGPESTAPFINIKFCLFRPSNAYCMIQTCLFGLREGSNAGDCCGPGSGLNSVKRV